MVSILNMEVTGQGESLLSRNGITVVQQLQGVEALQGVVRGVLNQGRSTRTPRSLDHSDEEIGRQDRFQLTFDLP